MSGKIEISKQLSKIIRDIARNDGGVNKKEIDSAKGYEQLCNLLSGNNVPEKLNLTETEMAYINTLKTQYEERYFPQNLKPNNMNIFGNGFTAIPPVATPFPSMPPFPNLPEQNNTNESGLDLKEI